MEQMWRPQHLTPAQLEERRLAAVPLLRVGRLSHAAIARRFGVSDSTVGRWHVALTTAGVAGLRRRPHPGRPPRLAAADWPRLDALLRAGARAAGFPSEQWTLRRVAALLRREFGVHYHFRSLGRVLRAHGYSVQHAVPRAAERDEAAVRHWGRYTWPAIKRGPGAAASPSPSSTRRGTPAGRASAARGRPWASGPCSGGRARTGASRAWS